MKRFHTLALVSSLLVCGLLVSAQVIAESKSVMFRTGFGYQHWFEDAGEPSDPLTDDERTSSGGDVHYGFDAFIAQPLILSAEARMGFVGTAFTGQLRATLGAALGPLELYAGYHGLAVGGVSLGGPLAGVRGWWRREACRGHCS